MSDTTKFNIASDKKIPDSCVLSGIDANGQKILLLHGCAVDKIVQLKMEYARIKADNVKMRKVLHDASDTMRLVIESAEDVMQPHLVQEICHCGLAIEKALASEGGAK